MNQAVIELGSNIDPEQNIEKAKSFLNREFGVLRESFFTRTRPIGQANQKDFLNGAVLLETKLTFEALKSALKKFEQRLGRDPSADPYGPRKIDLDIVVWNGEIVDQDFYSRKYLRESVLELMPELKKEAEKQRDREVEK